MSISKIEAAERQLVAAVELFFEGRDSIATYTLVSAAREVSRDLCRHLNIAPVVEQIPNPQNQNAIYRFLKAPANFFKHADRDATNSLPSVTEEHLEMALQAAFVDFRRAAVQLGLPIPWQLIVYDIWCHALAHKEDGSYSEARPFFEVVFDGYSELSNDTLKESAAKLLAHPNLEILETLMRTTLDGRYG